MTAPQTTPPITVTAPPSPQSRIIILLKSKAVWGAVIGSIAWILNQPHIDAQTIVQAIGMVTGAVGVRDAITQHGINNT